MHVIFCEWNSLNKQLHKLEEAVANARLFASFHVALTFILKCVFIYVYLTRVQYDIIC